MIAPVFFLVGAQHAALLRKRKLAPKPRRKGKPAPFAAKGAAPRRIRGLGLVDETVVDRVEGELEAVGNAELIENVVEVIFNGLLADE